MFYLKLGIPSVGLVTLDWWAYEVMTVMAGLFGVEALSSQVLIQNLLGMTYRIGQGLDSAGCTLIGKAIGSGNVNEVKRVFRIFIIFSILIISLEMLMLSILIKDIFTIYTDDEKILTRSY